MSISATEESTDASTNLIFVVYLLNNEDTGRVNHACLYIF